MSFIINHGWLIKYEKTEDEVFVSDDVNVISRKSFSFCRSLKKVVLPASVQLIQKDAFYKCGHIDQVVITGNPKIEDRAFSDTGVAEFVIKDSTKYIAEDGVVFNKKKTKMILFPTHKDIAEYRIPEGVTSVAPYVLNSDNAYVLVVYLPKSLQKIPKNAFRFHCNDRPEEDFDKYKKYVQWGWFSEDNEIGCWLNGTTVYYNPDLINSLGSGIYIGGPIDDLPGKYKRYAAHSFLYALQIGIKEVEPFKKGYFDYIRENEQKFISVGDEFIFNLMLNERLISLKIGEELLKHPYVIKNASRMAALLEYNKSFSTGTSIEKLSLEDDDKEMKRRINMEKRREEIKSQKGIKGITFVATGDLDSFGFQDEYTNAKDWSDLHEYIETRGGFLRSAVSSKTDYLICNDQNTSTKKWQKAKELGVTIITEKEFLKMAEVSEMKTDDTDFVISNKILKKYNGKEKVVYIPDGVKKIALFAFSNNSVVEEIYIPEGVTEICEDAFNKCNALKRVSLPNSLQKIGQSAFWCCRNLEEILIPKSVISIGTEAFYDCINLKKVTIFDTVQKIIKNTFWGPYDNEVENWFVKDWEIQIINVSNDESVLKQLIAAFRYENLAYTYLRNKLVASDLYIEQIVKWLKTKSKRAIIMKAAISMNEVVAIDTLFHLDIKISENEIDEYIEEAKKQSERSEIIERLSLYKQK